MDLERVHYMPQELRPGVLYVSEEFGIAAHLCACGCGSKIRTPLGPTEWCFEEAKDGPTLRPSIGNWQRPCRSHYWISRGEIHWAEQWTPEQIAQGRKGEEGRRRAYYAARERRREGTLVRVWCWIKDFFGLS